MWFGGCPRSRSPRGRRRRAEPSAARRAEGVGGAKAVAAAAQAFSERRRSDGLAA